MINPGEMMVGGALLILLAMYSNQGREVPAMTCLALVLAGAGAARIVRHPSELCAFAGIAPPVDKTQ